MELRAVETAEWVGAALADVLRQVRDQPRLGLSPEQKDALVPAVRLALAQPLALAGE